MAKTRRAGYTIQDRNKLKIEPGVIDKPVKPVLRIFSTAFYS